MYPGSHSAENVASAPIKRAYRHSICTLAYVRLDHANGGIIRNLSDSGMAIQAVGRLHPEQVVHLRFELMRPRAKFELVGQVTWADAQGQAGVRFTDVSRSTRRLLQDWILTDLLSATAGLAARVPALMQGSREDGLVMSALPFRPIQPGRVESQRALARESSSRDRVSVPWWPTSIRLATIARFIDAIVVVSAVLLFSIVVAALTDIVPSWSTLAFTMLGLGVAFTLLYGWLCRFIMRDTLGRRLAQLTASDNSDEIPSTACDAS